MNSSVEQLAQFLQVVSDTERSDEFLVRPTLAPAMWNLLSRELDDLATVVKAEQVISDPDRREAFLANSITMRETSAGSL